MKKNNKHNKKKDENKVKINRNLVLITVIAVVVIIGTIAGIYISKAVSIKKYTQVISKDQVRESVLGFKGSLTNPRILTDPVRFSDSFTAEDIADNNGNVVAKEVTIIIDNPSYEKAPSKIPSEAAMLLIVDNDLKIKALVPFSPTYFDLGIDFEKYFYSYKGKDADSIIKQTDGIYTGISSVATIIKNKVREAMSFLYIEKYGREKFNALGVSGYVFAERGTKLEDVAFKDINGIEHNLKDFKNEKFIIIGGNPNCGSCIEDITQLSNYMKTIPNIGNIKFVVFTFTSSNDDVKRITSLLPSKFVIGVADDHAIIASKLKVNSSPTIELVDKDLTVYYRGPGMPTKETLENIKVFLKE
jgi:thiol-disulfide isomerase/thioredoxin